MKDYEFRPIIDEVLREMISKDLNLSTNCRGPDFWTKDRKYAIEMKCRLTNKPERNDHFSIRPKQFKNYKELIKQTLLLPSEDSPIYRPDLLFLFLRYSTQHPVKSINDLGQENITVQPSYLVDHDMISIYFKPELKWMTVQTSFLKKKIKDENIEAVEIEKPKFTVFPIGEKSEKLIKRWL